MEIKLSRRGGAGWLVIGVAGLFVGLLTAVPAISSDMQNAPSLEIVTKYGGPVLRSGDSGDVISILGSGFAPKQPVELNIEINGVPVNMTGMLKPEPVANDTGAFVTIWPMSKRMYRKSVLGSSGLWTITAVDANGAPLASAPFGVCDSKQGKDKREPWCLLPGLLEGKSKKK